MSFVVINLTYIYFFQFLSNILDKIWPCAAQAALTTSTMSSANQSRLGSMNTKMPIWITSKRLELHREGEDLKIVTKSYQLIRPFSELLDTLQQWSQIEALKSVAESLPIKLFQDVLQWPTTSSHVTTLRPISWIGQSTKPDLKLLDVVMDLIKFTLDCARHQKKLTQIQIPIERKIYNKLIVVNKSDFFANIEEATNCNNFSMIQFVTKKQWVLKVLVFC